VELTVLVAAQDEDRAAEDLRVDTVSLVDQPIRPSAEDIMATCTDITRAEDTQVAGLHRLGAVVARAWNGYWEYRANRAAVRMLYSLDAHSLHDIGISRSEIESVVYRPRDEWRR
jgi:uncharacterized protein YjiS (DUF1127 family)